MKRTFGKILLILTLTVGMILPLMACGGETAPADTSAVTEDQTSAPADTADTSEAQTEVATEEAATEAESTVETDPSEGADTQAETEAETEAETVVPNAIFSHEDIYQAATQGESATHWNQSTAEEKSGYVTLTSTGTDPWVAVMTDGKTLDGTSPDVTRIAAVKYRTEYSLASHLYVDVKGVKNQGFYWKGDGEWHLAVIDFSNLGNKRADTTLLRLDFAGQADIWVDIQYIAFFESAEDALTYDATVEDPTVVYDLSAMPEFKVSGAFGSHMVVQRDQPIKIWGFANEAGREITGEFGGETVTTTVAPNGKWVLTFEEQSANPDGQTMTISDSEGNSAVLEDILIGDVWLVGGQSNAELTVAPCASYTPGLSIKESDAIRVFTQTQAYVAANQNYCIKPQADIINSAWSWKTSTTQAVYACSAIGYFFAKEVYEQTDVPQGVIMMAAGGATLSELLPADIAHDLGYTAGANVREGGYYNTLINPFVGISFKGMLFFQGESEGTSRALADKYADHMATLIADERERFGYDFPLYYVQLSDYRSEGAQFFPYHDIVRIQQFDALEIIPNATMVAAMDLGAPAGYGDWAHSPLKYKLGLRLANAALAKDYDLLDAEEISSPSPVKVTLSQDKTKITVKFANVADGLTVLGKTPEESIGQSVAGFSVTKGNRHTLAAATIISADTVEITVPSGIEPTYVDYAYFLTVTPENATLYGSNELPAFAFSLPVSND